jgi:hypothetical protein
MKNRVVVPTLNQDLEDCLVLILVITVLGLLIGMGL